MTTYSFPAVTPTSSTVELLSNTATFQSPITGTVQSVDRGGERWRITLQYMNLKNADRAVMQAFLARLNGQQHRFTLHNHDEPQRGVLSGTPLVAGASQTGVTLNIDGVGTVSDWIMAGDWFSVNGELKMAVLDANSSGGAATLTFVPRLREAPADNAAVTVSSGTGTFILDGNSVSWSNRPGGFSDLSFSAIEDIAA